MECLYIKGYLAMPNFMMATSHPWTQTSSLYWYYYSDAVLTINKTPFSKAL